MMKAPERHRIMEFRRERDQGQAEPQGQDREHLVARRRALHVLHELGNPEVPHQEPDSDDEQHFPGGKESGSNPEMPWAHGDRGERGQDQDRDQILHDRARSRSARRTLRSSHPELVHESGR